MTSDERSLWRKCGNGSESEFAILLQTLGLRRHGQGSELRSAVQTIKAEKSLKAWRDHLPPC